MLTALQSAALRLQGRKPSIFFGSTQLFEMELCDLANEVAQDVARYQDWQALVKVAELGGDGVTTLFDLPVDYDRQMQNTDIQGSASWVWGYQRYTDLNAFLFDEARHFNTWPGGWIIYGNKLRFSPAPTDTAMYPYVSNAWAVGSDNSAKAAFDADTDAFVLPERLLTLGLIWRWRENKKLDASGDQEAFVKALDEYAAKDKGARIYRSSSRRVMAGTHLAWPWELG